MIELLTEIVHKMNASQLFAAVIQMTPWLALLYMLKVGFDKFSVAMGKLSESITANTIIVASVREVLAAHSIRICPFADNYLRPMVPKDDTSL